MSESKGADELRLVADDLAEPFHPSKLGWKPQTVKGNRCLAVVYIDARDVMDRLDAVFGVMGWQDDYVAMPDGTVMCRLSARLLLPWTEDEVWVTKCDVGGQSDQPDKGDKTKAAYSDALKRAAVKFGIGRYLYAIDAGWVDYDPVAKKVAKPPTLPDWALPYDMQRAKSHKDAEKAVKGAATVASPKAEPTKAGPTSEEQKAKDYVDGLAARQTKDVKPPTGVAPTDLAGWQEWWDERLPKTKGAAGLTELLHSAGPKVPQEFKNAVWSKIVTFAREKGYTYVQAEKVFIEPAGPTPEAKAEKPKGGGRRK